MIESNININNLKRKRENIDFEILFNSVWKNIYLNRLIFKFLKIYNIFYGIRTFKSIEELISNKNLEYFSQIIIENSNLIRNQLNQEIYNNNNNNINNNNNEEKIKKILEIPKWIELLHIPSYFNLNIISNSNRLHTLCIYGNEQTKEIQPNILPESITDLKLYGYNFTLHKNVLPKNLKKFSYSFRNNNNQSIIKESLPQSITDLTFLFQIFDTDSEKFPIKSNYLPKQLKYLNFDSIFDLEIPNDFELPESITNLSIKVKELNFKLPTQLKILNLRVYRSFIEENSLPSSLEFLSISTLIINDENQKYNYQQLSHKLIQSSSITSLVLGNNTPIIDRFGISILPKSLKTLSFRNCNERLVPGLLSKGLVNLNFQSTFASFDNNGFPLLENNIFPETLKYINFGASFNQTIGENVFPKSGNLKTIVFGCCFNQLIHPKSIPSTVELLIIKNSNYNHPIVLTNNNENTIIKSENINRYIEQFSNNIDQLKILALPVFFNSSIETLCLKNKFNLEKLIFDFEFDQELLDCHLPSPINSIKYLQVGREFSKTINLKQFPNLQTLVINGGNPIIQTTVNIENGAFDFYSLEIIQVTIDSCKFLDNLDPVFYQFIKLNKKINNNKFKY